MQYPFHFPYLVPSAQQLPLSNGLQCPTARLPPPYLVPGAQQLRLADLQLGALGLRECPCSVCASSGKDGVVKVELFTGAQFGRVLADACDGTLKREDRDEAMS